MADKLTPKQERFCQKYIELGNATEAYYAAYDAQGSKPITANRRAKELLDNSKIAARVRELQKMHLQRHIVSVDSITQELEEARKSALSERQPSAAVQASMGKAKLHGLILERADLTVRKPISEMTDEELHEGIAQVEAGTGKGVLPRTTH